MYTTGRNYPWITDRSFKLSLLPNCNGCEECKLKWYLRISDVNRSTAKTTILNFPEAPAFSKHCMTAWKKVRPVESSIQFYGEFIPHFLTNTGTQYRKIIAQRIWSIFGSKIKKQTNQKKDTIMKTFARFHTGESCF